MYVAKFALPWVNGFLRDIAMFVCDGRCEMHALICGISRGMHVVMWELCAL